VRKRKPDATTEIWFRVEGEARRLQCEVCGTARWTVVSQDKGLALLRCGVGHQFECADGFYFDKPTDY